MKNSFSSEFILDLAHEFDLFNFLEAPEKFPDNAFELLCQSYRNRSLERDNSLIDHIKTTPTVFRSFIPPSNKEVEIAVQTMWYYDEIIICDPALRQINNVNLHLPYWKRDVIQYICGLCDYEECIKGGYILFIGKDIVPTTSEPLVGCFDDLLNIPEIANYFENASLKTVKPALVRGNETHKNTRFSIEYDGFYHRHRLGSWKFGPPFYDLKKADEEGMLHYLTPVESISTHELLKYGEQKLVQNVRDYYKLDISALLEIIMLGQLLNSPPVFHREIEHVIAKNFSNLNGIPSNKMLNNAAYEFAVPYFNNIPSERLFDIKSKIPEAFKDFRYFLFELVTEIVAKTENPIEQRIIIEKRLSGLLRKLEIEIRNTKSKWRFQGVAAPLVVLAGSISLLSSGIDYSKLLSALLGSGGIITSLKIWNDTYMEKNNASLNPVYFLWKAQQLKKLV